MDVVDTEAIVDHDKNLFNLLTRAREKNLKFNKSKLKLKMKLVSYMGHLLTPEGVKVDPAKYKQLLIYLYHSVSKPFSTSAPLLVVAAASLLIASRGGVNPQKFEKRALTIFRLEEWFSNYLRSRTTWCFFNAGVYTPGFRRT